MIIPESPNHLFRLMVKQRQYAENLQYSYNNNLRRTKYWRKRFFNLALQINKVRDQRYEKLYSGLPNRMVMF